MCIKSQVHGANQHTLACLFSQQIFNQKIETNVHFICMAAVKMYKKYNSFLKNI
jgi:hypothetical protein